MRVTWRVIPLLAAIPTSVPAQSTVNFGGAVMRHVADTIWRETDSTVMRDVYHGDTVTLRRSINDRVVWEYDYLVVGDSSRVLAARAGNGMPGDANVVGNMIPTPIALAPRTLLRSALVQQSLQERLAGLGHPLPATGGAPLSPATPVTYAVTRTVRITHHGDTARYIRGALHAPADTTLFIFVGSDSVLRLSPAPVRAFGPALVASLRSQMGVAMTRARNTRPPVAATTTGSTAPVTLFEYEGGLMRSHGDTIWQEQDSTATVTTYRGDTVTTQSLVNGVERHEQKFVVLADGDSAKMLEIRDAGGQVQPDVGRTIPMFPRADARARFQDVVREQTLLTRPSTREPPLSTDIPVSYFVSPGIRIVQHRDTATYIRGCAPLSRVDTSVFVFFGADSVRRIFPGPVRLFGPAMTSTLIGNMRTSLVESDLAAHNPDIEAQLPPLPRCAAR